MRGILVLFEYHASKRPKAAQWPTSSELKIKFDPSLDRSWCEFFKIIKNHGPKNPPPGCNLGPKYQPQAGHLSMTT